MLFEHGAVLYSQLDDSFTTPRQLLLTENGFVYMGLAGIAVSVLYDDTGGCWPAACRQARACLFLRYRV